MKHTCLECSIEWCRVRRVSTFTHVLSWVSVLLSDSALRIALWL